MISAEIFPNDHQGARPRVPIVVQAHSQGDLPTTFTRMGVPKLNFLVRGLANVCRGQRVLELFSGSGLGTVLITRLTHHVVALDLHNDFAPWRFDPTENYQRQGGNSNPTFVAADARTLPFADASFDVVLAPDSPRTPSCPTAEQQLLFLAAAQEAKRVLRQGGVFAATAPASWVGELEFAKVVTTVPTSRRCQFKHDIVFLRATNDTD